MLMDLLKANILPSQYSLAWHYLINCKNTVVIYVFSGSHHTLQPFVQAFVENGYQTDQPRGPPAEGPQHFEIWQDKPILPEPTQLLLKAGDVVLCHQKLAHRGGPNYSHDTRKMIYFRVHHRQEHEHGDRTLQDLWLQMEGMGDVV